MGNKEENRVMNGMNKEDRKSSLGRLIKLIMENGYKCDIDYDESRACHECKVLNFDENTENIEVETFAGDTQQIMLDKIDDISLRYA